VTSLLIRNATLIDGSGRPARPADVLVEHGTISAVLNPGSTPAAAGAVLDAAGLTLTPGLIDLHSHSDLAPLSDPFVSCKLAQGITTEVIGQDGMSLAPLSSGQHDDWRRHMRALTGSYPAEWQWHSFAEYLRAFPPTAANYVPLVGHGTVRFATIGMQRRPPSAAELATMCGHVREALQAGAFGLSGGLVYTPGGYAATDEIIALNHEVARAGGIWMVHIRFEGDRILEALDEMYRVVEATGVHLHVSHIKALGRSNWGRSAEIIASIERQRAAGMRISADQYPYDAGSTTLAAILPPWVHAEGPAQSRAYLRDAAALARMQHEIAAGLPDWEGFVAGAGWQGIRIADAGGRSVTGISGRSLADLAADQSSDPFSVAVDLLLTYDLNVSMTVHAMSEDDVRAFMQQPWVLGGTDALLGGTPHPRAYGSYPRLLGHYVRNGVLTLEQSVHRLTGAAAECLGLTRRGRVAPGCAADLLLFDAAAIADTATFSDPTQPPLGIHSVIVNGQLVLQHNQPTGTTPGGLLRRDA
jgi:N-acyl-D-amino-acid deacylase